MATNPTITGIGHVAYTVQNMDKALEFYCDVLGFTRAFSIAREGKPWIEYIKVAKGQFLELFYGDGAFVEGSVSYNHLCLCVDDIFAVEKCLNEHGITLDVLPKTGNDKNWQCWAKDPDGNRIEFMQLHPDSKQMQA